MIRAAFFLFIFGIFIISIYMVWQMRLDDAVRNATRRLLGRRAAVALIFALSAPMLIAVTGLSVDIGYWYQNQTSLQSAADAAALAAAMSDARINDSTPSAKATDTAVIAQTAANQATNGAFNFSSNNSTQNVNPQISVACCSSPGTTPGSYTLTTAYTATVNAPRASFFSNVSGMGLTGMVAGSQYASATATITTNEQVPGDSCLLANPGNTSNPAIKVGEDGSNSTLKGGNCNFTSNCPTASDTSYSTNGSGDTITANSITVAGSLCPHLNPSENNNIYVTGEKGIGNGGVVYASNAEADPFASMGDPPTTWESLTSPTCAIPKGVTTYTVPNGPCVVTLPNGNGSLPANLTFSGGAYFFPDTELDIIAGMTVTFGPGIYYFSGDGNGGQTGLNVAGGANITANGSTFVFVSDTSGATDLNPAKGPSYSFAGGSGSTSLSAPTSPCVSPSSFPDSSYDGTHGEGICGILVYEARNDSTGGTLTGNSSVSKVNGVIYTPNAGFTDTGGSTITYTSSSQTFAIMAQTVKISGGGEVDLNLGTDFVGNTLSTTTITTNPPVLTQ